MGNFCGESTPEERGDPRPQTSGIRQFEQQRVERQPVFTTNLKTAIESADSGRGAPSPDQYQSTRPSGIQLNQMTQDYASAFNNPEAFRKFMPTPSDVALPISKSDPLVQKEMNANPYLKKIRDFVGGIMGYDTSTLEGLRQMEADKLKSQEFYEAGQEQRNKAKDQANMRTNIQGVGTPLDPCPEGYVYNEESQKCEPVETETDNMTFTKNPMGLQQYMNQFATGDQSTVPLTQYGRVGGEYDFFLNQGGPPRGPQGEVRGKGGPKDDLVGPFMLSNKEYVLPNEQIKMYGGGNYETGLKRLEKDRKNALKNYK